MSLKAWSQLISLEFLVLGLEIVDPQTIIPIQCCLVVFNNIWGWLLHPFEEGKKKIYLHKHIVIHTTYIHMYVRMIIYII